MSEEVVSEPTAWLRETLARVAVVVPGLERCEHLEGTQGPGAAGSWSSRVECADCFTLDREAACLRCGDKGDALHFETLGSGEPGAVVFWFVLCAECHVKESGES